MINTPDQITQKMHDCHAQWRAKGHSAALIDTLARAYHLCLRRDWNESILVCDTAIEMSNHATDSFIRAVAYFYKGVIYQDWGQFVQSETAYVKACDTLWLLGKPSQQEYALTRWALALLRQAQGYYDRALYDYDQAGAIFKKTLLEATAREEPSTVLSYYQEMYEEITASRNLLADTNSGTPPVAYIFPVADKPLPARGSTLQIIYYRDSHRFSINGRFVSAVPTSSSAQWAEFDRQLDYHVSYFAIAVEPAMLNIPNVYIGDYLLACLTRDNRISRRRENPSAFGLVLDKNGSYKLAPRIIGQPIDLYAYVDAILQAGDR